MLAINGYGEVWLLDVKHRREVAAIPGGLFYYRGSGFSEDGTRFACTHFIWSKSRGSRFRAFNTGIGNRCLALSPDGRLLAYSTMDANAFVFGIDADGNLLGRQYSQTADSIVSEPGYSTICMTFSPDSDALLMGYKDGSVALWRFKERQQIVLKKGGFD